MSLLRCTQTCHLHKATAKMLKTPPLWLAPLWEQFDPWPGQVSSPMTTVNGEAFRPVSFKLESFFVNKVVLIKAEQRFEHFTVLFAVCLTFTGTKILLLHYTKTGWHVCLRTVQFQRWISYVDNSAVISLGAAAEHTRLCNDKREGLSSPLRIPHKHRSDKPNFAQGSLHLLQN